MGDLAITPALIPAGIRDDRSRRMAELIARIGRLDLSALAVMDIDRVSASALPHLIWQFDGHDFVAEPLSEARQRALVKRLIQLHRYRGTVWAVRAALDIVGVDAELQEWWQAVPPQPVHTFTLTAWLAPGSRTLSPERQANLCRLVDAAKPVRSHYSFRAGIRAGAVLAAGAAGIARRTLEAAHPTAVLPRQSASAVTAGTAAIAAVRAGADTPARPVRRPEAACGMAGRATAAIRFSATMEAA